MSNSQAWRLTNVGLELFLRVTPNASADKVGAIELRDDGQSFLAVRVRAVPDKGKANKAVVSLLAKQFKLAKSTIEVIKGRQARQKCVLVATGYDDLIAWLENQR